MLTTARSLLLTGLLLPVLPLLAEEPTAPEPRYAMVRIPKGSFTMGVNGQNDDEKPPHTVTISADFYLGKYEVTQGEWKAVMGLRGAGGNPTAERCATYVGVSLVGDNLPVVCVSWLETVEFANQLSQAEGLTPAYTILGESVVWERSADGYRLPTEAEWEYAALAGTSLVYAGTSDVGDGCRYGNVGDATAKATWSSWKLTFSCTDGYAALAPVGKFLPNAWGLYDMTGNVWEWVWDWYGSSYYRNGAAADPAGASEITNSRVLRGGSWGNPPAYARIAHRRGITPSNQSDRTGFRLSRSGAAGSPP